MNIDFNKNNGLVPVIIQDDRTLQVLMLAYMNKEAFEKTISNGVVTFYSRSRGTLWTKGETSGNFLKVKSMALDCDNDTLLIMAEPTGPVCHTGSVSCFGNKNIKGFIYELEEVIRQRYEDNVESSYTNKLLRKGINRVAQKVGEEAVELVIESKDSNDEKFLNEAADLVYHLLVLLKAKGHSFAEVENILNQRHK
ncbi:MAG TPA: bifunctional phosphoribosyl-AMP cyclohydrolase/phosphoribosyl-ATP diphosphatase HisIE [Bacteroidales bacterium]|nr:bifunctional phosphoribosyl-AMP cyclohydrolase/phosphoribosyl-ATP diphosphatase HisIE [Bacteroidales bacterium]